METLDSTVTKGNPNASYWPYVTRFGVITGVIGAVLTLMMYIGGNGLSPMVWSFSLMGIGLLSLIINGVLATRGVRAYRETELGGLIPFGKAFLVAFLILLIGSLIGGLFNLLYVTVIDPDFANNMASRMSDWFAEIGMDEAQIELQTQKMKEGFSLSRQLMNLAIFGPIGAAIIGLISGAVAKRNPPMD
ncbi:MAG TPA: DUF4199 domain-containing protein [Haliscomenobacter sp.]|nr:DUF4199 domain-containing protein [Haliscomenobacter sp.]